MFVIQTLLGKESIEFVYYTHFTFRSRDRRKRPPLLRSSGKYTGSSSFLAAIDTCVHSASLPDEQMNEAAHLSSSEHIYEDLKLLPPRYWVIYKIQCKTSLADAIAISNLKL